MEAMELVANEPQLLCRVKLGADDLLGVVIGLVKVGTDLDHLD
jgi:hypothetical protein